MIRPRGDDALFPPAPRRKGAPAAPWAGTGDVDRLGLATIWTTGPDPAHDGAFSLRAVRRDPESGTWEAFERACDPALPGGSQEGPRAALATARMVREYGVSREDLTGAGPAPEAFGELEEFLRGRPVVVAERAAFSAWARALADGRAPELRTVDLAAVAGLLTPGRLAAAGEELPARLLGDRFGEPRTPRAPRAIGPHELRQALAALVGRALERDEAGLALLAHGYHELWNTLLERDPAAAAELALILRLVEHPSRWRGEREGLFPEAGRLTDGQLTDALRAYDTLEDALEAVRPPWARDEASLPHPDPLPAVADGPSPLDAADRRRIDEVFQEHLARRLAGPDGAPSYREGQHAVAARIAESFGERELLLMHAPTGTGKTLAYLVPTLLWAWRHGVRVGVATFTRALQEQAMERDVPLALEALTRIGLAGTPRVGVLKGRSNYLCWRAFLLQLPAAEDPPETTLAWLVLALFGLGDDAGDLDRLSQRPPLALDPQRWRAALGRLLGLVRAESGCCQSNEDRRTCGAEAARGRAERSHVVITNHAFALSRREFFRHLIFDECEHLHDVAHNAFSHAVGIRALRELLGRLHRRGAPERPLNRISAAAGEQGAAAEAAVDGVEAQRDARAALDLLQEEIDRFDRWRAERGAGRRDSDSHSLFREYATSPEATGLLAAHADLTRALNQLAGALARAAEHLDSLPLDGRARLRRTLEVLRGELDELLDGVERWIPRGEEGQPEFRPETFYDLERTPAGEDVLAARVLLPHEYLGRHYYPDLVGAVLLSATTWLKGGFDAAATFLGLARAAHPAEDEERLPSEVRSFRAPDAFDYGRVLVAVPRDAPPVRERKEAFLTYAARFVAFLAERTRGRCLVLFTNAEDCRSVGRRLEGFFSERRIPFWYQRMEGSSKEELGELFRSHVDSVLLGLDTFWYGTDFPGATLEYLVIVRLPYGVPDRYHHAQCASLGPAEQRRQVYMPRALAKLRQGFGRLMRKEEDRGAVFVLDRRILDPRHRVFLRELPVSDAFGEEEGADGARLVVGDTDRCIDAALAHMEMKADVRRRGLAVPFAGWSPEGGAQGSGGTPGSGGAQELGRSQRPEIRAEDVPF